MVLFLEVLIYVMQIKCSSRDKLVHILALLKLELVQKKVLIFTNTIDMSFRLKLFLEQVGQLLERS